MKKRIFPLHRSLLAAGIAVGFSLSQTAMAETAEGDLVITAGLEQSLTVVCESDLNFGVIRVDTGLRGGGGETKIEAIFNSIFPQVTGEEEGITAALVDPGTCDVTNSRMPDNSMISISFPEFVLLTGAEAEGLDAAATSGGNEISMRVDNFDRDFGTGRIL